MDELVARTAAIRNKLDPIFDDTKKMKKNVYSSKLKRPRLISVLKERILLL